MSTHSDAPAKVFLGVPNMGEVRAEVIPSLFNAIRPNSATKMSITLKGSSALTFNFNMLWTEARNRQKEGVTHFAMLHADVVPDPGWLDILLEELRAHDAAVVSGVIPLKDLRGLTTTAIGEKYYPDGFPCVRRRLTVRECRKLPTTFTAADAGHPDLPLFINTGCFVCDLRQSWVDKFPGFSIVDGLYNVPGEDRLSARFFSEDWFFGLWLHMNGVKAMATTAVGIAHIGTAVFRNDTDWGLETDPTDGGTPTPEKTEAGAAPYAIKTIPLADVPAEVREQLKSAAPPPEPTCEIVAVRYAEDLGWVHDWLDDLLVKHGPNLTYRIYDKGPQGDTANIGNLDWTYLHHIVTRWDELADWTVFTQADPFPHLERQGADPIPFEALLLPAKQSAIFPFLVKCREWGDDGRLHWHKFPDYWKRQYENGTIHPAKLSLREWFKEFLDIDIDALGNLEYHPGAIFAVSRAIIHRRPKAFYERFKENLGAGNHRCPEESHHLERAWPYIFVFYAPSTQQYRGGK